MDNRYVLPFQQIDMTRLPEVGGKNASLGEMVRNLASSGIVVPDGFAITVQAFWDFLDINEIREQVFDVLHQSRGTEIAGLHSIGETIRHIILHAPIPDAITAAIISAYRAMGGHASDPVAVAVRSSATAEDLPTASFAGQQESFLNICGEEALLDACRRCYASLYTDRAIAYREAHGFPHEKVGLSIGIQYMVRSDKGCAGVGFTLEPETGFRSVIHLSGSWGLGENVVQGAVNPDEFLVFKPTLRQNKNAILSRKLGSKLQMMVLADPHTASDAPVRNIATPLDMQTRHILTDEEITRLAHWALLIEEHYDRPMDFEWAKDGLTGELFIVQARPETVHSGATHSSVLHNYTLGAKSTILARGSGLGNKIAAGRARILHSPSEADLLQEGEVLVTDNTNPDWDPILKKAAAIVTNKGGRTSHAAIVAREMGTAAVVGTGNATETISDGEEVTVSCAEGKEGVVYDGILPWHETEIDLRTLPIPRTQVMLILGDPARAFQYAFYPNNGVGLMRIEFIITSTIKIHPMALVNFEQIKNEQVRQEIERLTALYPDKKAYFVERLAQAVATIAAAFYPKDVIVRMSDFKTNEYANLLGGQEFEPKEENPMIGFRGASRYYHPSYREGFRLECLAMKNVREEMGLTNVKLMIPFCRTVEEGRKVVEIMAEYGLKRGVNNLEIYVMAEIPSNVVLAEQFAEIFDGFSIGSNDLTQLTLGIDRDSSIISDLFDENNEAPKAMIATVIEKAKQCGAKIGLCGQAPSDKPDFAQFLVHCGIDSISFTPDALFKGIENIIAAEKK